MLCSTERKAKIIEGIRRSECCDILLTKQYRRYLSQQCVEKSKRRNWLERTQGKQFFLPQRRLNSLVALQNLVYLAAMGPSKY